MKRIFIKLFIISFVLMFTYVCDAATSSYSWTGLRGKKLFDEIQTTNEVSYTINTQAGTVFSFSGYGNRGVSISVDGTWEKTYNASKFNYSHTFSSSGSHIVTVSGAPGYVILSNIIVAHPSNVAAVQSISLDEAGDLKYHLTDDNKYYITKLNISGPLNGEDMKIIRDLGSSVLSELKILNLSGAQMKSGGGACGTYSYEWTGSYGSYEDQTSSYTVDDVIDDGLFCNLQNLVEVTLPESITEIRYRAFQYCTNLEKVTMGNSTTIIENQAFAQCRKLKTVTFSTSTTEIKERAFEGCTSLSTLTLPEGTKSIGIYAFRWCSALTTVSFPSSISSVSDGAFAGCTAISRTNIASLSSWCAVNFSSPSANPTYYSKKIYLGSANSPISSLTIPEGVSYIGSYCFSNCTGITSITLPGSVTSINYGAFYGCTGFSSLIIPEGVTQIGDNSFEKCSNIQSVEFPSTLTRVGQCAFDGCSSIKKASAPSIAAWCSINFWPNTVWEDILDSKGNVAYAYDSEDGDYKIQQAVPHYKSNPLYYSNKLYINNELVRSLDIPEGVISIGSGAFAYCSSITHVSIPKSVTTINQMAFYKCNNISAVSVCNINAWNNIQFGCREYPHTFLAEDENTYAQWGYTGDGYYGYYDETVYNYSSNPIYGSCTSTASDITKVQWSSTTPTVAQVDSKGAITALSSGSTMIIATTDGNRTFCTLEVNGEAILIQSVALSETSLELQKGETKQLIATILPSTSDNKTLSWSSSDESVAAVNEDGLVTANETGTATITATATDGSNVAATCKVTVVANNVPDAEVTDIAQYDHIMYLPEQEVISGLQSNLCIRMKNSEAITAFSFGMKLPEGITIAKDSKGKNIISLDNDRKGDHSLTTNILEDGTIKVAALSMNNDTFSGNEGVVIRMTVNVAEEMAEDDYYVKLNDVRMVTSAKEEQKIEEVKSLVKVVDIIPGDVNGDREISIVDAVGIVSFIIQSDTKGLNEKAADANRDGEISIVDAVVVINQIIHAGSNSVKGEHTEGDITDANLLMADQEIGEETTFTLPIRLTGKTQEVTALQSDLTLPEGLTLSKATAQEGHEIICQSQENGTIRMALFSTSNETLSGNGDVAVELELQRDATFTNGLVTLSSTELVSPSLSTHHPTDVQAHITSGNTTGITNMEFDDTTPTYDASGRRATKHTKGLRISKKRKEIYNK